MRIGTRPSLGPSTRARQSSLCIVGQPAVARRSWRHRGWANLRKREEPAPGSSKRTSRGSPPITALVREKAWCGKKRKVVEAIVPARKRESSRSGCPHVVMQLQKSSGDLWSRISSAYAQQKLRQGRVNGDLARSERRWVKPPAGTASERSVAVPANARENGIGPDEDPGGARASSAVGPSSKRRCVGRGTGAVAATGS